MATPKEMEEKLWSALESDMTVMLGIERDGGMELQPMTAQVEEHNAPIWFFTSKDTNFHQELQGSADALAAFASKDHQLFANIRGRLVEDNDREVIDRLWNRFIAAWYEGGKGDPKLALLRFDARDAHVWLNEHTLVAGVKLLLGVDPKRDYRDRTASVRLDN